MNPRFDTPFYVLKSRIVRNPHTRQDEEVFERHPKKRWCSLQEEDRSKVYSGHSTEIKFSHLLLCDYFEGMTDSDRIECKGHKYYIKNLLNPPKSRHFEIALERIIAENND